MAVEKVANISSLEKIVSQPKNRIKHVAEVVEGKLNDCTCNLPQNSFTLYSET